jgi:hypothetical protein
MKILATAITLGTVLASPVYANSPHRTAATAVNQSHRHAANGNHPMFLLEDTGTQNAKRVPNFQDDWDVSY